MKERSRWRALVHRICGSSKKLATNIVSRRTWDPVLCRCEKGNANHRGGLIPKCAQRAVDNCSTVYGSARNADLLTNCAFVPSVRCRFRQRLADASAVLVDGRAKVRFRSSPDMITILKAGHLPNMVRHE